MILVLALTVSCFGILLSRLGFDSGSGLLFMFSLFGSVFGSSSDDCSANPFSSGSDRWFWFSALALALALFVDGWSLVLGSSSWFWLCFQFDISWLHVWFSFLVLGSGNASVLLFAVLVDGSRSGSGVGSGYAIFLVSGYVSESGSGLFLGSNSGSGLLLVVLAICSGSVSVLILILVLVLV